MIDTGIWRNIGQRLWAVREHVAGAHADAAPQNKSSRPVAYGDLCAARLPGGIEALGVVRPDVVVLDPDTLAVAHDTDLAVVMDVAVAHHAAVATSIPEPLLRRTSQSSMCQPTPSRAWTAPFCATLAYFSTITLLIRTSLAKLSNAKNPTVSSTLRPAGSSATTIRPRA
jgi:hypothetical protein